VRAAESGHTATVEALIQAGADPNLQNDDGWTALMWASGAGHTCTVEVLIGAGAKLDLQTKQVSKRR
jgi:ankyrin repeat protein